MIKAPILTVSDLNKEQTAFINSLHLKIVSRKNSICSFPVQRSTKTNLPLQSGKHERAQKLIGQSQSLNVPVFMHALCCSLCELRRCCTLPKTCVRRPRRHSLQQSKLERLSKHKISGAENSGALRRRSLRHSQIYQ